MRRFRILVVEVEDEDDEAYFEAIEQDEASEEEERKVDAGAAKRRRRWRPHMRRYWTRKYLGLAREQFGWVRDTPAQRVVIWEYTARLMRADRIHPDDSTSILPDVVELALTPSMRMMEGVLGAGYGELGRRRRDARDVCPARA
jgi:hypothetical protein